MIRYPAWEPRARPFRGVSGTDEAGDVARSHDAGPERSLGKIQPVSIEPRPATARIRYRNVMQSLGHLLPVPCAGQGASMGDATRDDSLGRDATRALPVHRRPSPDGIRYASSGVVRARRTTAGATSGGGVPYGTEAYGRSEDSSAGQVPSRGQVPSGSRVARADWGMPGQHGMPGQRAAPVDGSRWPGDRSGAAWPSPEPGPGPGPGPEPEPGTEPGRGWFGQRHPDLWVFGGSAIVAAAAMVTAFAAASGATAMGYSQGAQGTATHAPVRGNPVTRAGPAPAFGPACISPASPGAGH
jgi:hypothetical protein